MHMDELRELPDEGLRSELDDAKSELFNLRFQAVIGQLKDTKRIRTVRRSVARIKTILRGREIGIAK